MPGVHVTHKFQTCGVQEAGTRTVAVVDDWQRITYKDAPRRPRSSTAVGTWAFSTLRTWQVGSCSSFIALVFLLPQWYDVIYFCFRSNRWSSSIVIVICLQLDFNCLKQRWNGATVKVKTGCYIIRMYMMIACVAGLIWVWLTHKNHIASCDKFHLLRLCIVVL